MNHDNIHRLIERLRSLQPSEWPPTRAALRRVSPVTPALVGHPPLEQGQSVIGKHGRRKKKRRVLGIYIPSFRKMVASYARNPYKLIAKRLPQIRAD
jgi:hypothetical protein